MDNLSDWLYIVLLGIAGVSSLFSSKKKKKSPTEVLGQPDRDIVVEQEDVPQKGFWEILEEMQKEKPQPVARPVARPTPSPAPFLTVENNTVRKKAQTVGSIMATSIPAEESKSLEFELGNPAELRKALIYAEILNRKY